MIGNVMQICRRLQLFSKPAFFLISSIIVLFVLATEPVLSGTPAIEATTYLETRQLFGSIPGMESSTFERSSEMLQALSYTQLRAFRAFCRLADIRGDNAGSIVERLSSESLTYETALVLEYFTALPSASVALAWDLLDRLKNCDFVAARAIGSIARLRPPDAASLLPLIDQVKSLDEPGQWAAKAIFETKDLPYADVLTSIDLLAPLHPRQLWAVEQLCRLDGLGARDLIRGIRGLQALRPAEAWNIRALMQSAEMTPEKALDWMYGFFTLPRAIMDETFKQLTTIEKDQLLTAYGQASEEFTWDINNLHDVTDTFGAEIGESRLMDSPPATLDDLFARLHPTARASWASAMNRAKSKNRKPAVIAVLRKATAQARRETAGELSTANLYALLAGGNDLYTSSFRDIIVPILDSRIKTSFRGDILNFLVTIDPAGNYSSQFIANLAAKGTFTRFLPPDADRQKQMIGLFTRTAFRNEYSLLLFSAAMPKIIGPLLPPARSHLLERMLAAITDDTTVFSRQIQAILQYYLENQDSNLLSRTDRAKLAEMVTQRGRIDLGEFLWTPFKEWTMDGALKSLSIFQQDDDGRNSFLANCRALLDNGYTPALSTAFTPGRMAQGELDEPALFLQSIKRSGTNGLIQLFRFSAKRPIVIAWHKILNGIEITHAVAVYQSETYQLELIRQFLRSDYEMFAQRGHSYWRRHQLFAPLSEVLASGAISDRDLFGKQRFLSLGSCGGMKAYLELSDIFHNRVDLLATVGMGSLTINNLYNRMLFELVAAHPGMASWEELTAKTAPIFTATAGEEYLQPGSLPALLHKMTHQTATHHGPH